MVLATVLFIGLAFLGPFTWWHGCILLAVLMGILWDQGRSVQRDRQTAKTAALVAVDEDGLEGMDPTMPGWKIALYLVFGLVGLPIGARILVVNSEIIAKDYGVPETAIGLTLIAVGTSLPELATSTIAALRRQGDVALGNVIGSNMFNLLAIIGIAAFVGPIPVDAAFLRFDLWIMLAASLSVGSYGVFQIKFHSDLGRGLDPALCGISFCSTTLRRDHMRALVTGGAIRLGREMAVYLAGQGYDVAVHYAQSDEAALQTCAEIHRVRT